MDVETEKIENASKTKYEKSSILFFVVKILKDNSTLSWISEKGRGYFGYRRFDFRSSSPV